MVCKLKNVISNIGYYFTTNDHYLVSWIWTSQGHNTRFPAEHITEIFLQLESSDEESE